MPDSRLLEHARNVAAHAARDAGRLIRRHAGRLDDGDVAYKDRHDLVTEVDRAAQRIVLDHLTAACPDFDVLAEEDDVGRPDRPTADGFRWIVDPIDGTTNFVHGIPPYAVSIGLQHEAEIVVGVVYEVAGDELFTAVRGGGLYLNGVPAGVGRADTLERSVVATGFPYRAVGHLEPFMEVLRTVLTRTNGFRRLGSAAVDLAYVACGRLDAFYETDLAPWDVAAGLALVREGGGRVSTFTGAPDPLFAPHLLATNGALHPAMLELLGSVSWDGGG